MAERPQRTTSPTAWPALLREHYGESFSIARRLAGLVTVPRLLPALGPAGMRSDWLMTLALRWMGNLVTDEDRDRAARVWRWAGRRSLRRRRTARRSPDPDRCPSCVRPPTGDASRPAGRCRRARPRPCASAAPSTCPAAGRSCWPATTCRSSTSSSSARPLLARGRRVRFLMPRRHLGPARSSAGRWTRCATCRSTARRRPRRTCGPAACCARARRSASSPRPGSPRPTPCAR